MKKILLSLLLMGFFISLNAQVSSLSENFNTSCASTTGFPVDWAKYNPVSGTTPAGVWTCAPAEGRDGTPGISCTDTFGTPTTYHLDTSYLITPLLDVRSYYPDSIYLYFDSKATSFYLGGKLSIITSGDTTNLDAVLHAGVDTNLTDSLLPLIGEGDSSGWVTHQVNLTSFESRGPFYLAFRYTSPATSGNTWYLDNINTSTVNILRVADVNKTNLPLKVIGSATSEQITMSYTIESAGRYNLEIYDMMGRVVYKDLFNAQAGTFNYYVNNLNLRPGMYLIKMGNGNNYGTTKVIIQ